MTTQNDDEKPAVSVPPEGSEEIHRLVKMRMEKADHIRAAGLDPYANDFRPEMQALDFTAKYGQAPADVLEKVTTVTTLAGRVMSMRQMGKATFLTIRDATGDIQVLLQKNRLGDSSYAQIKNTDLGDIIGLAGTPMRTKTGELTLGADGFRVLTKALRPLPDKWHGLADVEQRYRQRYVDLIVNPDVRRVFRTRARVIRAIQNFLDKRGYLEVETPVLTDQPGGATARPFHTHHNALDVDLYMRIATELPLKRLVVGGLERVYEIGRIFRNEGVSTKHNPEFTSIELYEAYATYTDLMEMTEELVTHIVDDVHGHLDIPYGTRTVSFQRPWRRVPIARLVGEHLKLKEDLTGIESVARALELAVGHTVTAEEPLAVVLRELSDEEADRLIPGMQKGNEGTVARARAALKAGGPGFYTELGRVLDTAWEHKATHPRAMGDDDVTAPGEPAPGPAAAAVDPFDEPTGTVTRGKEPPDSHRARRRRLALSLLYSIFDHEVEATITNPTFITDFPVSVSPLARRRDSDPAVVDRFELIIAGMEIANAFNELNDPIDQRQRFLDQAKERDRGDVEAHSVDEDFVRALEIGMPPTAGEGLGIDRFVMLLTNAQSIRDVILFPQMRPGSGE